MVSKVKKIATKKGKKTRLELIRVSTLNMRLGHDNRVSLQIE